MMTIGEVAELYDCDELAFCRLLEARSLGHVVVMYEGDSIESWRYVPSAIGRLFYSEQSAMFSLRIVSFLKQWDELDTNTSEEESISPERTSLCFQCEEVLPESEFYQSKRRPGEPTLWCKPCLREYHALQQ